MAEVIVLDSSSDDDILEVYTAPRHGWRAAALQDAFAMVSTLQKEALASSNARAKAKQTDAKGQAKKARKKKKKKPKTQSKPPAKRSYNAMQRKDSWSSSSSSSSSSSHASSSSTSARLSPVRRPRASHTNTETFSSPGIVTPEKPRERSVVASVVPARAKPAAPVPSKPVTPVPRKPAAPVAARAFTSVLATPLCAGLLTPMATAAPSIPRQEIDLLSSSDDDTGMSKASESEEDKLLRSLGIPSESTKKVAMKTAMGSHQRKRLRRHDEQSVGDQDERLQSQQQQQPVAAVATASRGVTTPPKPRPSVPVPLAQKTKSEMKMKRKKPLNGLAAKSFKQKRLLLPSINRSKETRRRGSDRDFESDEFEMYESSMSSSSEEEWPLAPARSQSLAPPKTSRKSAPIGSNRPRVHEQCVGMRSEAMTTAERSSLVATNTALPTASLSRDAATSDRMTGVKELTPPRVNQKAIEVDDDQEVSPQRRPRRQLESQFNTDQIALQDIQAQEAEFARIRAEKAALDMHSAGLTSENSDRRGEGSRRPLGLSEEMDLCSLSEHESDASIRTADTTSVRGDHERRGTPSPSLSVPSIGKISPVKTPRKDLVEARAAQPQPRKSRGERKPRKPIMPTRHPRSTWEGPRIPCNVLSSVEIRPYEKFLLEPLSFFDRSGELEYECAYLETFGQAQHLGSSYLLDASLQSSATNEDTTKQQVRSVLHKFLPVIRRCNARRSTAVIEETRSTVRTLLHAQALRRQAFIEAIQTRTTSMEKVWSGREATLDEDPQPLGDNVKASYCRGDGQISEKRMGGSAIVVAIPRILTVGTSVTCVTVKRSIRVEDDPILRFVPPPSDQAQQSTDAVTSSTAATTTKELKSQGEFALAPSAIDDEVTEFALRAVVARCGDSEQVFSALKTVAGLSQARTDYSQLKDQHDARTVAARRLVDASKLIEDASLKDGAGARSITLLKASYARKLATSKSLRERLSMPPTFFESNMIRWLRKANGKTVSAAGAQLNVRPTEDYGALLESYRDLFCRICYCYDCQVHGIEQPQPTRRVDPTFPRLKSRTARVAQDSDDESEDSDDESEYDSTGTMDLDPDSESSEESDSGESERRRRSSRSVTVQSTKAAESLRRQEQRRLKSVNQQQRAREAADMTEYVDYSHVDLLSKPIATLLSNDTPCSGSCWRIAPVQGEQLVLDPTVEVFVQKLVRLVGTNACVVAAMIKTTSCGAVHAFLEEQRRRAHSQEDWGDDRGDRGRRSKKESRSQSSRTSSNRELLKRSRLQRPVDHSSNHAYEPCRHEGPCNSTACTCLKRDHFCEKACSCPRDCPNRFQGCRCSFGACRTMGCPCVAAGRECDPDLCVSCGAGDMALSVFQSSMCCPRRDDALIGSSRDPTVHSRGQSFGFSAASSHSQSATCANAHLQRGAHRKIAIGPSDVHGWGGFAVESIRRGDYIAEYPGELISQDEAERRGLVYDQKSMTYLFDLNEDEVVDAIRQGNKTRFINHGTSDANCEAKTFRVGAEHRITIWAKRDIQAGEELFFDYGSRAQMGASADSRKSDSR